MIKLLTIAIVAGLIYESHQQGKGTPPPAAKKGSHYNPIQTGCSAGWPCYYPTHLQCWTPTFQKADADDDDWHAFDYLHAEHPEKICPNPIDIESNVLDIRFSCYPPFCGGGVCWSDWKETTRSGGSVSATISGEDCLQYLYIEARTVDTMIPALDTGEYLETFNPSDGFVCNDADQGSGKTCSDYKVRFGCSCTDYYMDI